MPRQGWASISLTKELIEEIDSFVKSEDGKKLGFSSRTDLIARAVTDLLEEHKPRLQHLNMLDDNVKVIDFGMDRIATIIFRENGSVYCELCRQLDCEHIKYALEQRRTEGLHPRSLKNKY